MTYSLSGKPLGTGGGGNTDNGEDDGKDEDGPRNCKRGRCSSNSEKIWHPMNSIVSMISNLILRFL